jgi:hypothetical protein
MSGQAGRRRSDDYIVDGQHRINRLIECLCAIDLSYEIDEPANATGEWWIDLGFDGYSTNVMWSADRGFGVFTSDDDSYASRPDEVYREPELAAKRLLQLAKRARNDRSAMKLGEMRKLVDQPQTVVAKRLRKDQGFISRLERRNDALMSTLREYVEALGGEVRLMVRFDGFEAPVDLPTQVSQRVGRRSSGARKSVRKGEDSRGRLRGKSQQLTD